MAHVRVCVVEETKEVLILHVCEVTYSSYPWAVVGICQECFIQILCRYFPHSNFTENN